MTSPHSLPVAEIPADDATLDAILRQGLDAGRWPFALKPGQIPMLTLRRIRERLDVIQAARARIAAGLASNRMAFRTSLFDQIDAALDVRA